VEITTIHDDLEFHRIELLTRLAMCISIGSSLLYARIINKVRILEVLLNPFQIIVCLICFTLSLTTRLIKKIVQNITSFVMAFFVNKSSSRMT